MSLSLFLFIVIVALIYCLTLIGARYTPDEIFTIIRDDLAAIPASVKSAYEAVAGTAAALAWLWGPSAFCPGFWRALRFPRPRRRKRGAHAARTEAAA